LSKIGMGGLKKDGRKPKGKSSGAGLKRNTPAETPKKEGPRAPEVWGGERTKKKKRKCSVIKEGSLRQNVWGITEVRPV